MKDFYTISAINSDKISALLVWVSFTNFPSTKVAKVGRLETLANFLDSGDFSASTKTNVIAGAGDQADQQRCQQDADQFLEFRFHNSTISTPRS